MYQFCTYFDSRYLTRGLALYRSLVRHTRAFRLHVLCLDESTHAVLQRLQLPEVRLISLEEFERADTALAQAKQNRSRVEYYFTCTPSLPLYVFQRFPEIDLLTYLDADLYFFSDPASVYQELGTGSILLVGHRFPAHWPQGWETGIYNVGLLSFRRDALDCLRWWRERCLEWCYYRVEDGKFAEQKYLDDWPERFPGVVVLQHKGANLAPWNVLGYKLEARQGRVWVDTDPLIFYHFSGIDILSPRIFLLGLDTYGVGLRPLLRQHVYAPYLGELQLLESCLATAPTRLPADSLPGTWDLVVTEQFRYSPPKYCLVRGGEAMLPEWEYVPEGMSAQGPRIRGWNVESVLAAQRSKWGRFVRLVQGNGPLGVAHEAPEPSAEDRGAHNTIMAYAYVLALAARKKDALSLLDWGGGLGHYCVLSRALLPDVRIEYHCKDGPLLCAGGRELLPDAIFHDHEEECFKREYDLVLASSSLQYSHDWKEVVRRLAAAARSYLYVTRLPIVHKAASFAVVQRPYRYGYDTEYVGWVLNRQEFLSHVTSLGMELVRELLISEPASLRGAPEQGECRGFLFRPTGASSRYEG